MAEPGPRLERRGSERAWEHTGALPPRGAQTVCSPGRRTETSPAEHQATSGLPRPHAAVLLSERSPSRQHPPLLGTF